mgnify:CR=1 FL=1
MVIISHSKNTFLLVVKLSVRFARIYLSEADIFYIERNLHFLSKNSTLISRENCLFFCEKLVKMLIFWTF